MVSLYRNFSNSGVVVNLVFNVEDLRKFISKYHGVISESLVVLSDLANFQGYQSRILKFIEEQKSPVVCISSKDGISPVLMSRFMTIIKYPTIVPHLESSNDSIRGFILDRSEEDFDSEEIKLSVEDCIKYYPPAVESLFYLNRSNLTSKRKVITNMFGA